EGIAKAPGFTYLGYRDAIKKNMLALKKAFKISVVVEYVNFMPGESLPLIDKGLMKSVFDYGEEMGVAIGAPDLMPKKPYQQAHAYKFLPGESLPLIDKGLMKSVFDYGEEMGVAIGAPDLMPKKPYQQAHAYKFMQ